MSDAMTAGPIGVFDSGYGGLTVLRSMIDLLPQYDYVYLGDNARAPYGTRSLDTVYRYTLEGVDELFNRGCHLVILACNTASANALRTIQQRDLASRGAHKRVLGVIRPTTERLSNLSQSRHLGVMATEATVRSGSYVIEAEKYAPAVEVYQMACPMWVPLIENEEHESEAAVYFTKKYIRELLAKSSDIDAILLACTHYPIIFDLIREHLPSQIRLLSQGILVADALKDYLTRHAWMDKQCAKGGGHEFLTTDDARVFESSARRFFGADLDAVNIDLGAQG